MDKYKRLLSNTLIFAIGTFSSKVLVFLLVPFYTNLLTKGEMGTADLIVQTANLIIPIVSIGMSLGGLTGYAINPARDWGPRMAHTVLPIREKGSSNWSYAPITLVGPVIGAIAAVLLYQVIPWG